MAAAVYAKMTDDMQSEIKDITEPADCCSSAGYINCYNYALESVRSTLAPSDPQPVSILGAATCGITGWYQSVLWIYSLCSLIGTVITVTNSIGFCVVSGGQYWQVTVIWAIAWFILLPHIHAAYVFQQHNKLVDWVNNLQLLCMNVDFGTTNRFFKVTVQSLQTLDFVTVNQRQALAARLQQRRVASFKIMVYQPVWKEKHYDRPRRWIYWLVFLNTVAWVTCIAAYIKIGME